MKMPGLVVKIVQQCRETASRVTLLPSLVNDLGVQMSDEIAGEIDADAFQASKVIANVMTNQNQLSSFKLSDQAVDLTGQFFEVGKCALPGSY